MTSHTKCPKLRDFPAFRAAEDQLHQLQYKLAAETRALRELDAEYSFRNQGVGKKPRGIMSSFDAYGMKGLLGPDNRVEHYRPPERPLTNRLDYEAAKLVVGGDPIEPPPQITSMETLVAHIQRGRHQCAVLDRAVRMQQRIVEDLAVNLTRSTCLELQPEYFAKVRTILDALVALSAAEGDLDDFIDGLRAGGMRQTSAWLPGVIHINPGKMQDITSILGRFAREAEKMGAIPAAKRAA